MAQGYQTADVVADMEQELHELRTELDSTSRSLELMTADRNRLQIENALLDGKAREMLIKSTRTETLLNNVAQMIVSQLKEAREERQQMRAARRQEQVQTIEHENEVDPPPEFLRRDVVSHGSVSGRLPAQAPAQSNPPRAGITEEEGRHWRGEALRGAAERMAPPPRPVVTGRVNPAIAGGDSRLPQNEFRTAQQQDEDNLRDIAEQIGRRS